MAKGLWARAARPYGCEWLQVEAPAAAPAGGTAAVRVRVANRGLRVWRSAQASGRPVDLVVRVDGAVQAMVRAPHDVAPGQAADFSFAVRLPGGAGPPSCRVELGLVEQNVAWFAQHGVAPRVLDIRVERYGVEWLGHNLPGAWPARAAYEAYVHARNTGGRAWRAAAVGGEQPVDLALFVDGALHALVRVPHDVAAGEDVLLAFPLALPEGGGGGRQLRLTFVEQDVAWFDQGGAECLTAAVRVGPPAVGPLQEAMAASMETNRAFWLPAEHVMRSRTGRAYPSFVKAARGCRIQDVEGNEWIDMVMSGGSAILGYANAEITEAIAEALGSSAVITLPHVLEIEVSRMLSEMIPSAELVLFGKHGSDACTAAVRIARLHTGRRKVLFSGYHGWHDWFAEGLQPALRAAGEPASLFRFFLNDLEAFERLVEAHRGEVAAVMLEPAAQAESVDGPIRDVGPAFLRGLAEVCRREGIVLIFDEIITGFRYRQGSVQKAHGVVPDMTCLGKALSAGMPLSALVGKREIMAGALPRACYYPTFRGEVYSLAAAKAALRIHARDDPPAQIERFGKRLADGVNAISREVGVAGKMVGTAFRMIYCFDEPNYLRRRLKRTLLQQELLQRGVLTFVGYMLPSAAHGEAEMDQVLGAFRGALEQVEMAAAARSFAPFMEIPLMG
jgi:glutamate-1-semialdehyde 2,1-aminomutase